MAENEGQPEQRPQEDERSDRRGFISATTLAVGGMACGYGMLFYCGGRYLYPANGGAVSHQFVCTVDQLRVGEAMPFTLPSGAKVVIARQAEEDAAESFIALSSVCPHLGCQVHWEAVNDRFFCPCHNGAFDASGAPIEGPPQKANQHLTRFPLLVQDNLLMIAVPMGSVEIAEAEEQG